MSWQADPAYDAMLAQQIETARLQSQAGLPAVANAALARPATFSPTSVFPKRQSAASHA
jgi:hypothetical protein